MKLFVCIWAISILSWPGARVNVISYHSLRSGMTLREVESLLGCKAGDHRLSQPSMTERLLFEDARFLRGTDLVWISDFGQIGVAFDFDGKLSWAAFASVVPSQQLPLMRKMQ